jgi:hypothetical protein
MRVRLLGRRRKRKELLWRFKQAGSWLSLGAFAWYMVLHGSNDLSASHEEMCREHRPSVTA